MNRTLGIMEVAIAMLAHIWSNATAIMQAGGPVRLPDAEVDLYGHRYLLQWQITNPDQASNQPQQLPPPQPSIVPAPPAPQGALQPVAPATSSPASSWTSPGVQATDSGPFGTGLTQPSSAPAAGSVSGL